MISADEARSFSEAAFPEAPEKLAAHLGIEVRQSDLDGCDGWCLTTGVKTIVRLNGKLGEKRRRFTLAHELGHLILGIPSIVGESLEDMLRSNSTEEKQVNALASELLLPKAVVSASITGPPVVAGQLQKLAKKANVSEIAAAIRVCNLAREIGLMNASVVFFDQADVMQWRWSTTLSMTTAEAKALLNGARKTSPGAFRTEQGDDVIVASIIDNPYFGSTTMFVQMLPGDVGHRQSPHERRMELESQFYHNNEKLRNQMSGFMGALKQKRDGKTPEELEADFWSRNLMKVKDTIINCDEGREYIRLRIAEWY